MGNYWLVNAEIETSRNKCYPDMVTANLFIKPKYTCSVHLMIIKVVKYKFLIDF